MTAAQAPDIEARLVAALLPALMAEYGGDVKDWTGMGSLRHVAAAVLAAGFVRPEDVAEAQAKALEDAADAFEERERSLSRISHSVHLWANACRFLRDRAAALRPVDAPEGGASRG